MIFNKRLIKHWLPVILWMCVIYWMSTGAFSAENTASLIGPVLRFLLPMPSSKQVDLIHAIVRKSGHVTEYFILGLLLFRAFRADASESWNWRWPLFAAVVVILWAVSDEFHQAFVPSREASIADVGIDVAGGILAQVVNAFRFHRKKK